MKYSGPETYSSPVVLLLELLLTPYVGQRNNKQGSSQFLSPLLPRWTPDLVSTRKGVTTANVGKRKAFSIGAEKHGVDAFSKNEIELFECCDDDVIKSGEMSEEGIVALVNEKNNTIVDSSSDMEEEQDETGHSIADAKAAANVLNNFSATENNDEYVVDLFKIVDKTFDELYIKSKTFQFNL
ncbi:hypothetical protein AVEN_136998-1 [Araneus ventricosus]|uniref:Uncharacterized protein n=1 Tax=Araneus ventricosus TaxID=182803 RepID=A0A4Y2SFT6_ARAVE|nr:hypothetical protein AVEN_136998-1 [Araneus ventricosus]